MPSEKHNRLAELGLHWIRSKVTGRGLRGGFEVPLADGYTVDAVGLCSFQHRFVKRYLPPEATIRVNRYVLQVPELICVFEAKATRADFLSTFGGSDRHANRKDPVGHLHWCVAARGICQPKELPDFWGLLVPQGGGLREIQQPTYRADGCCSVESAAWAVLWYAKKTHTCMKVNRLGHAYDNL